jgi:hypothetical protein
MAPLLSVAYLACLYAPTEHVLTLWQKGREIVLVDESSQWKADKTTCGDYAANERDGSGFVIWLDGYNRGKNPQTSSVLESDAKLNAFLDKCKKQPQALMADVLKENAESK